MFGSGKGGLSKSTVASACRQQCDQRPGGVPALTENQIIAIFIEQS